MELLKPEFSWKSLNDLLKLLLMLLIGSIVGSGFAVVSMPLPFFIGGLLGTIGLSLAANTRSIILTFPKFLRKGFVALVGVLIGATISPESISSFPNLGLSMVAVLAYVCLAHTLGFFISLKFGGYHKIDAFYASMPGGFVEAVEIGERSGGNLRILVLSHLLRVLLVVILVPILFWLVSGETVGSSANFNFQKGDYDRSDLVFIFALGFLGLILGRLFRLPAGHLLGPIIISVAFHGAGVLDTSSPIWLLYLAQLFIGVGLGTQFSGSPKFDYKRVIKASVLATTLMLCLSALFAFSLDRFSDLSFSALFLSFAPGGVSEMGLIALSLGISPVMVAAHHMLRIFFTVFIAGIVTRTGKID